MLTTISADVAIYGAGHGGLFLARDLAKRGYRVVLVDPHAFMELCSATVRNLVVPGFAERAIVDIASHASGARFVQGKLIELLDDTSGKIELSSKQLQRIRAKTVVLCTGTHYEDSISRASREVTRDERLAFYRQYAARVNNAETIVIVGAGPVGVELAGEIISEYPNKSLTVVNAASRVLPMSTEIASRKVQSFLDRHQITTIHNARVNYSDEQKVTLAHKPSDSGEPRTTEIPADMVIWAVGGKPSSDYMQANFAATLNDRGEIVVDDFFLVQGCKNVFAFADVAFLDNEPKLAKLTSEQLPIVAHNVREVLEGGEKLRAYRRHPKESHMGITLGPKAGVFQVPIVGHVSWGWFARYAKSRDMNTTMFRDKLGLK